MTLLAYRPELVTVPPDEADPSGLPQDMREEFIRIHEQAVALVLPLTNVRSLSEAERLAELAASDYIALATESARVTSETDALRVGSSVIRPLVNSIQESPLMSEEAKEQLQGALQSFAAYVNWYWRSHTRAVGEDERHRIDSLVLHVQDQTAMAGIAFSTVAAILNGHASATPEAISILAELADHYWTEVEDVFLSLAEYNDEGGTVPLSEAKAELGL